MSHCGPKHECECGYIFTEPASSAQGDLELLRKCEQFISASWAFYEMDSQSHELLREVRAAIQRKERG